MCVLLVGGFVREKVSQLFKKAYAHGEFILSGIDELELNKFWRNFECVNYLNVR